MQNYILLANRQNIMKFVILHICSLLNISLKYRKQLPFTSYSDYYQGTLKTSLKKYLVRPP